MTERVIFCCGPSVWTRVIGWIMSITHTICTLTLLIFIVVLPYGDILIFAEQAGSFFYGVNFQYMNDKPRYVLINFSFIVLLISAPVGAVSSILLLIGSYKKKPTVMVPWVVFMVMNAMVQVILEIIFSIFSNSDAVIPVLINISYTLCYSTFFVWLIATHLRETEMSLQPARSVRDLYKP